MFRTSILRIALAVAVVAATLAYFGMPYISDVLTAGYRMQAEHRAKAIVRAAGNNWSNLVDRSDTADVRAILKDLVAKDPRLLSLILCRADGSVIAQTEHVPRNVACKPQADPNSEFSRSIQTADGRLLVSELAVDANRHVPLWAVVVQDLGFADWNQAGWRGFVVAFVCVSALAVALLVAFLTWWLLRRWAMILLNDIRSGRLQDDARSSGFSLPILSQVQKVLREAEENQRREIEYRENWTPQALQQVVQQQLQSCQIITVSNREPYSHTADPDGQIKVQVPASGMVTALEPVMRACSGVWVAHGSGSADRSVVDTHDRIQVPPDEPSYALRRVWLTQEEEEGYYFGFSNEGLWPLCHLAYVRPAFRDADWQSYQTVNQRFADVVVAEANSDRPVVLIQDFHFALLPQLLRSRIPQATIALFWHVPWPNAETFGVCPWKREILSHMLQADILGFHTLYHCQNFLDTVDRVIECQIDRARMTVTLQGHVCQVNPYPISIEWPPRWLKCLPPDIADTRATIRSEFGIGDSVHLGVGVERWDFTKGIIERCQALEAFLDQNPKEQGNVTLLQVTEPSRSRLPAYQALQQRTVDEVDRINARFKTGSWQPIILIKSHQDPQRVYELYRAADFCLVTSLHDGMNLVAKEFVAARDDEDGVLVLSTFTGASRELVEALPVNPYNIAETAAAIAAAINMSREERRQRMRLMRQTVKDNNVYRWAGRMLIDIARIRQHQALVAGARHRSRFWTTTMVQPNPERRLKKA